jgi:hypothetical protein
MKMRRPSFPQPPVPQSFWEDEKRRLLAVIQPRLESLFLLGVRISLDKLKAEGFQKNAANKWAIEWALEHTDTLLSQLMDTTVQGTGEIIATWLETPGATMGDLHQALMDSTMLYGVDRASRIAVTEVTRALAEGEMKNYLSKGIGKWRWNTNRDEGIIDGEEVGVCPVCQQLHGQVVEIGEPFGLSKRGQLIIKPPDAHVGDRCWVTPVVEIPKRIKKAEVGDKKGHPFRGNQYVNTSYGDIDVSEVQPLRNERDRYFVRFSTKKEDEEVGWSAYQGTDLQSLIESTYPYSREQSGYLHIGRYEMTSDEDFAEGEEVGRVLGYDAPVENVLEVLGRFKKHMGPHDHKKGSPQTIHAHREDDETGMLPTSYLYGEGIEHKGHRDPKKIEELRQYMEEHGEVPGYILVQRQEDGRVSIVDGNHRVEMAHELDIQWCPVQYIRDGLTKHLAGEHDQKDHGHSNPYHSTHAYLEGISGGGESQAEYEARRKWERKKSRQAKLDEPQVIPQEATAWRVPPDETLKREFAIEHEYHGLSAFPSEEAFLQAVKEAKVVEVTPEIDKGIEYRTRTQSQQSLLNLIRGYASYPKYRNEKTLADLYQRIGTGQAMDMPLILDYGHKRRVFSGNTRMDVAFQLGKNPQVLWVKVPPLKKHLGPGPHPSGTPQEVHGAEHQGQGTKKEKAQLRSILKFRGDNGEKVYIEKKGNHWETQVRDKNGEALGPVYKSHTKNQMIRSGNLAVQDIEAEVWKVQQGKQIKNIQNFTNEKGEKVLFHFSTWNKRWSVQIHDKNENPVAGSGMFFLTGDEAVEHGNQLVNNMIHAEFGDWVGPNKEEISFYESSEYPGMWHVGSGGPTISNSTVSSFSNPSDAYKKAKGLKDKYTELGTRMDTINSFGGPEGETIHIWWGEKSKAWLVRQNEGEIESFAEQDSAVKYAESFIQDVSPKTSGMTEMSSSLSGMETSKAKPKGLRARMRAIAKFKHEDKAIQFEKNHGPSGGYKVALLTSGNLDHDTFKVLKTREDAVDYAEELMAKIKGVRLDDIKSGAALPDDLDKVIFIDYDEGSKYSKWVGSVKPELGHNAQVGIEQYGDGSYHNVNKWLRRGIKSGYHEGTEITIERLDEAFKAPSGRAPQHLKLWRGTGFDETDKDMINFWNNAVGTHKKFEFTDNGFMSSSVKSEVGMNWGGGSGLTLRLEIEVPQGSKVLPLGSLSGHSGEREVLFPRGSTFIILSAEKYGSSTVRAKVRYINGR